MPKPKLPRTELKWNSNLAYAVGLLTTDGYLSTDKRHISFTSTDRELIKNLLSCLNKTNKISPNPPSSISKKPAYRTQVGDVVLYDWLYKIGLSTNKSLRLSSIKIPNKYFPDFLRGHLDGDGSVIYYKDHYNTSKNPKYVYDRLFVFLLSSSKAHILWLQNKTFELKRIKGSLQTSFPQTQKGKHPTFRIKFSTKEAKILLNWIYYKPDLPCLKRKFNIARPFLNI